MHMLMHTLLKLKRIARDVYLISVSAAYSRRAQDFVLLNYGIYLAYYKIVDYQEH